MNFGALVIGLATFLIIGLFHPIVIKGEYYFSKNIWPVFLIFGLGFCVFALFVSNTFASALLAILGFTCLWSIKELFEQENRVKKGWYPQNPNRKN